MREKFGEFVSHTVFILFTQAIVFDQNLSKFSRFGKGCETRIVKFLANCGSVQRDKSHILDVGCGNGSFLRNLVSLIVRNTAKANETDFRLNETI